MIVVTFSNVTAKHSTLQKINQVIIKNIQLLQSLNECLLTEPPIISYKPKKATMVTVNLEPAQQGCPGEISHTVSAGDCIQDDNCEKIEKGCNVTSLTIPLENLPLDPHEYTITAIAENNIGTTNSTATYVFGAQLREVTKPKDMLQWTPGTTTVTVTFNPPCPFAGNLTYDLSVKASINISNTNIAMITTYVI